MVIEFEIATSTTNPSAIVIGSVHKLADGICTGTGSRMCNNNSRSTNNCKRKQMHNLNLTSNANCSLTAVVVIGIELVGVAIVVRNSAGNGINIDHGIRNRSNSNCIRIERSGMARHETTVT